MIRFALALVALMIGASQVYACDGACGGGVVVGGGGFQAPVYQVQQQFVPVVQQHFVPIVKQQQFVPVVKQQQFVPVVKHHAFAAPAVRAPRFVRGGRSVARSRSVTRGVVAGGGGVAQAQAQVGY